MASTYQKEEQPDEILRWSGCALQANSLRYAE
jgi:hypothetical protein